MVQFFGEDPKKTTTTEIFGIFADFITKFEVLIAIILFYKYTNSPNMMHHKHGLYNTFELSYKCVLKLQKLKVAKY